MHNGAHPGRAVSTTGATPATSSSARREHADPSADDRFAYAFTAFAASGLPIQVWTINQNGVLTNVTRTQPDLIKKDALVWWHAYVSQRGKGVESDVRGVLAAWCADEYLLGDGPACTAELKTAVAKGYVSGAGFWPSGTKFVAALHKSLSKWGYLKQ